MSTFPVLTDPATLDPPLRDDIAVHLLRTVLDAADSLGRHDDVGTVVTTTAEYLPSWAADGDAETHAVGVWGWLARSGRAETFARLAVEAKYGTAPRGPSHRAANVADIDALRSRARAARRSGLGAARGPVHPVPTTPSVTALHSVAAEWRAA